MSLSACRSTWWLFHEIKKHSYSEQCLYCAVLYQNNGYQTYLVTLSMRICFFFCFSTLNVVRSKILRICFTIFSKIKNKDRKRYMDRKRYLLLLFGINTANIQQYNKVKFLYSRISEVEFTAFPERKKRVEDIY